MAFCKSCGIDVAWWNISGTCNSCSRSNVRTVLFSKTNVRGLVIDLVTNETSVYFLLKNGRVIQTNHEAEDVQILPFWNVVSFAAASSHIMIVTKSGQVHLHGTDKYQNISKIPQKLGKVVEVFTTESMAYALLANGTLVGWGREWDEWKSKPFFVYTNKKSYHREMQTLNFNIENVNQVANELKNIERFSMADGIGNVCVALRKNHTIYAWGAWHLCKNIPTNDNQVIDVYIAQVMNGYVIAFIYMNGNVRFYMDSKPENNKYYTLYTEVTNNFKISQIVIDSFRGFAFLTHEGEVFVYSNERKKAVKISMNNLKAVKIILKNSNNLFILTESGLVYSIRIGYENSDVAEIWGLNVYKSITEALMNDSAD